MHKKRLRKGQHVTIIGNSLRRGVVEGKFQGKYVILLDKPYKVGRGKYGKDIISRILAHPDNISDFY
jgi:hypothetical protein